jgi:intracellular sulfur oxidation DsrE/DsrF family protein
LCPMKPIVIAAFFALAALPVASFARTEDSAVIVAGKGISLEQAVDQPHAANYRLLVLREELLRLRASPAEEEVRLLLKHARRDGAVVFVCERDLRAERLERSDLMPGVVSVAADSEWANGTPSAGDLALRKLCS